MDPVLTKSYRGLTPDRREILRYAGAYGAEELPLLEECLAELREGGTGRVCWRRLPVKTEDGELDLGFARVRSAALERNLRGCGEILLFAATAGLETDRLSARYSHISPAKALLFHAIGAAQIESVCDRFCADMASELDRSLRPRFSPGYGDLPLALQRDIVAALDCPRKIGLTLNDSLLMSPSKSVTAIAGLEDRAGPAHIPARCAGCGAKDCEYRCET